MFSISKRPTIGEIHDLYRSGKAVPTQVLQFFLNRSKQTDKKILAFNYYTEDIGNNKAKELDILLEKTLKDGEFEKMLSEYPLFGIPYSVKSIIMVEGGIFNAGSKILDNFTAPYSSTVYKRVDEAGGVLVGINHMDQFAMGSSGETSDYAVSRNPFDTTRIAGGSSSGPIAAVASGQVVFSLGTDTGGSIRQPAAFCDVVGLKPTYGLVSRYGVMPMASSLDQVGPISNNVEDNIVLTKVLSGKDDKDQTTIDSSNLDQRLEEDLKSRKKIGTNSRLTKTTKPLKIGIPKEFYVDGINPQIMKAMKGIQAKLESLGHELVDVSIPLSKYAISVYYLTMPVEVAANLERIDGVRYAWQQEGYGDLYFEHRGKYFGDEAQRRIMLGTYVSSAGYYDAYYNQAQKVRELARQDMEKVFQEVDVLLTPTTPEFPFKIGEKVDDPLKMYLSDVFTCGINPVRIPGLNVPLGLFDILDKASTVSNSEDSGQDDNEKNQTASTEESPKLPTGCQILGPELSEDVLFSLAEEIETIVKSNL